MTKIALSGANGRMGKVIAGLVSERSDCEIVAGIDVSGGEYYTKISDMREQADVIIDFSHSSATPDLLTYCKMKNIPLVIATTGYKEDEIQQIKTASGQVPIFFTFNMSLGINLLQDLARRAVRVLGEQFDVEIIERHHNRKKDAPSGTAIMLAEAINDEFDRPKRYIYDRHNVFKPRERDEIGLHAVRGGTIVGEHEIVFAGHDEVITLSHSAQSREVFAVGAINAALFMAGRENGLYDMSDLLNNTQGD
ncbi:MAG: 4-hydroxy-tetrahydrodipicolinate reductase [Oscillospiraceae bacterium]|nr:4-hydroxy-tetrahydrodipicolinate reductase [Oscillospiraceae bacterium]